MGILNSTQRQTRTCGICRTCATGTTIRKAQTQQQNRVTLPVVLGQSTRPDQDLAITKNSSRQAIWCLLLGRLILVAARNYLYEPPELWQQPPNLSIDVIPKGTALGALAE